MKKFLLLLVGCVVSLSLVNQSEAQVAYVTYCPTPVPVTTYYAPPPAPVAYTSYYAPAPVVTYQPVPVTTTRYRPFLGGTVTRVRTGYAPIVIAPAPVVYSY